MAVASDCCTPSREHRNFAERSDRSHTRAERCSATIPLPALGEGDGLATQPGTLCTWVAIAWGALGMTALKRLKDTSWQMQSATAVQQLEFMRTTQKQDAKPVKVWTRWLSHHSTSKQRLVLEVTWGGAEQTHDATQRHRPFCPISSSSEPCERASGAANRTFSAVCSWRAKTAKKTGLFFF